MYANFIDSLLRFAVHVSMLTLTLCRFCKLVGMFCCFDKTVCYNRSIRCRLHCTKPISVINIDAVATQSKCGDGSSSLRR